MKYERILRAFAQTPFALMPEKAREIMAFLELKSTGAMLSVDEVARRIGREPGARLARPIMTRVDIETGLMSAFPSDHDGESDAERERRIAAQKPDASTAKASGSVAVINIYGVINQRASGDLSTETASTEKLSLAIRAALANPETKALVLNIDSPGGSVYGVAELGAEIMRLRGSKPIIAQANSLMASAAYWIGSACDELVCTPSGEVGSIGVYGTHQDWSAAYEDLGVKFTMIKAGKFKAEGVDWAPLGDEATAYMQKRVDDYYSQFVRAVAKGRGVSEKEVRDGFGEGRVVGAAEAVKLKMADRVGTLQDTLSRLGVKGSPSAPARAVAEDVPVVAAEPTQPEPAAVVETPAPAAFDADMDYRQNRNRLRQRRI